MQNKLRKTCMEAKRTGLRKALRDAKGNLKAEWAILRELIPNASKARASPTRLNNNGEILTDPTRIANAMNDHYITIGDRTAQTIPDAGNAAHAQPASDHPPFDLKTTTLRTVTKLMNTLNRHKASDIYDIKPSLIRDLTPTLAPILTDMFNRAIREHEYPEALKLTKVIELYKNKDIEQAIN